MSGRRIESALVHQLRAEQGPAGKLAVLRGALRTFTDRFDAETVEILAGELKPWFSGLAAADFTSLIDTLPQSANTAYLCALLAGDADGVWAWERFFAQHYSYDPFHRLAYARSLAAAGRFPDAARQL